MTRQEAAQTVAELKREFHSMMNGAASGSMREKGLSYAVNFGVEGVRLAEMAKSLPSDAELAAELWRQRVRECRLLATMVEPAAEFAPDLCDEWIDSLTTTEEAQYLSLHLLSKLPYAEAKALEWTAADNELRQLCGLLTIGRLLRGGTRFYARARNELLDQAEAALHSKNGVVARAALNALQSFAAQNSYQEKEVERIFSSFANRNSKP